MKKINSEILLVVLVALWGLSFSMTKPFLSTIGVFNFLSLRFIIGGGLLVILLLITGKFKMSKALLKSSFISGVLLFIAFSCHILGLKYTSIAKNSFLVGSSVIFIPVIMLIVYKAKSDVQAISQTILAIAGLAIITLLNTTQSFNIGDFITLVGSVVYAFYTIQVERFVRQFNVNVFTAIQLCTVGVFSLIATLLFEEATLSFSSIEWLNILFLSVLLTGVAYYILNSIQKNLSASNVTIIFTLEPFFATLFGWFFLSESIGNNVLIGGGLIILSVMLPYVKGVIKPKNKVRRRYEF